MAFQYIREMTGSLMSVTQSLVDRVLPPKTRHELYTTTVDFSSEQPLAASFLFTLLFFTALPLLLFTTFVLTVAITTLSIAMITTLLLATLALGALIPTLVIGTTAAVFIWSWALFSLIALRFVFNWLYNLAGTPEIHAEVKSQTSTMSLNTSPKDGGKIHLDSKVDHPQPARPSNWDAMLHRAMPTTGMDNGLHHAQDTGKDMLANIPNGQHTDKKGRRSVVDSARSTLGDVL